MLLAGYYYSDFRPKVTGASKRGQVHNPGRAPSGVQNDATRVNKDWTEDLLY